MRALLAASVATVVLLLITAAVGIAQIVTNYLVYGSSYAETVTINGVESNIVISWYGSTVSVALLFWLILLVSLQTMNMYRTGKTGGGLE